MNNKRFNTLTEYFENKFGEKTFKICIDAGFTCPNRDGKIGYGGCIFCSEKGSGEHINYNKKIENQINDFFASYKADRANKFIAYFQNFSNTYGSLEELKTKYDSALINDKIVGLAVATRPDCITEDIAKLLKSYTDKYYVWVELGLQTTNEEIGLLINRGYTNKDFSNAVNILNKYNIDVVTHIMIGLPNETFSDIENNIKFLNSHKIKGLKIHSTYVVKNTKLAELYKQKKYIPISLEYYIETTCYILTHLSPDIIIHRISGDAPKELLLAPDWNMHKKWVMNGIDRYMRQNDLWQGQFFQ